MAVHLQNTVTGQEKLLGGRACGLCYHRGRKSLLGQKKAQNDKKPGQKVHKDPGQQDDEPLVPGAVGEGPGVVGDPLFLPLHGAEAADGKQAERVFRLPFLPVKEQRTHADGELVDLDAAEFCGKKVTKFVESDEDPEH